MMRKWGFLCAVLVGTMLVSTACEKSASESELGSETGSIDEETGSYTKIENKGGFNIYSYRKVARKVQDDGWVFTFVNNGDKSGDDSDILKYQFYGINIRYKYNDDYVQEITHVSERGTTVTERKVPAILIWGSASEEQKRDMQLIDTILSNDRTAEELLALNPDDYTFEALDQEMFFELMRTALTSAPQKEGTDLDYWDKPTYAFYVEPEFIDDYKFQVAFLQETGCVDELFIDVQYRTGDEYDDYIQLSDLVDAGTATKEQQEVFEKISSIVEDIKEQENFIVDAESYKDLEIGEIDFSRLYTFLNNIHENKFDLYEEDAITQVISED
jgi:hypothetical protein